MSQTVAALGAAGIGHSIRSAERVGEIFATTFKSAGYDVRAAPLYAHALVAARRAANRARAAAQATPLLGTLALGILAAPMLPALGPAREGPLGSDVRMPLGWRKAGAGPDRLTYTNELTAGFRASASVSAPVCAGKACACAAVVAPTSEQASGPAR